MNMKKKIILAIASMLILGLSIAAFAYSRANVTSSNTAACCCCSGDSCPMKSKDAKSGEKASCCDDCDCCKGGAESCPMKMKGEKMQAMHKDMDKAATEKDGCCCPCCNKDKEKQEAPAA